MFRGRTRSARQRLQPSARKLECTLSARTGVDVHVHDSLYVLYCQLPERFGHACCRYVILPKDFEKGYKANMKKSDTEFAFYQ